MTFVAPTWLYWLLAILYLILTGLFIWNAVKHPRSYAKPFFLGLVLIGPPVWFFIQFHLLPGENFNDQFKYNQDLASKIWAAVSAFALAIAFRKEA